MAHLVKTIVIGIHNSKSDEKCLDVIIKMNANTVASFVCPVDCVGKIIELNL